MKESTVLRQLLDKAKDRADEPTDHQVFAGYLAKSSADGKARLYVDLRDLDIFVELDESDIAASEAVPAALMPGDAVYIWIRRGARLAIHTRVAQETPRNRLRLSRETVSNLAADMKDDPTTRPIRLKTIDLSCPSVICCSGHGACF